MDAHVAHSTALRILDRLGEEGLVLSQDAGPARLFRLNPDHVLTPVLHEVALTRTRLIERFRTDVESWPEPPFLAVIFGSFARGDAGLESDVDILVVRPPNLLDTARWERQLNILEGRGKSWCGNPVSIIDMKLADLESETELLSVIAMSLVELTDGARTKLNALL